jgi:hypothetical protein
MLQRWIQENKRFLGGVAGALFLLLIFNWLFVWDNETAHVLTVKKLGRQNTALKGLYNPSESANGTTPLRPLSRTLKKRKEQRDKFASQLRVEIARYGSAPSGEFILPAGEDAWNYYFGRRSVVVDELEQAAAANAVNVEDTEFGLPGNRQGTGGEAEAIVRKLLWQTQLVRRAVGAAIGAGVDTIEDVQLSGNLNERSYTDGGYRAYGIPMRIAVNGPAGACAAWLESLQDVSQGYVVIVATEIKRDPDILGNVEMRADLMGMQHESVAQPEGEDD